MPDHDPILIRHLKPRNFLSFGPENEGIELKALNLLIGPNGSGKSNFIEAISFIRATPKDIRDVFLNGGGVAEWIWKGKPSNPACVEVELHGDSSDLSICHGLSFQRRGISYELEDEWIWTTPQNSEDRWIFYHQKHEGHTLLRVRSEDDENVSYLRKLPTKSGSRLSILSKRTDPDFYPELALLGEKYGRVKIYREWSFGRQSVFREPQKADMRNDGLEEDFSNLGLFLSRIKRNIPAKRIFLEELKNLYQNIDDFDVFVEGGAVQVFFIEGNFSIPATRLSDGTLRYLCLLAILCDPEPPPLICIEEPELGLHPDILPKLADLLKAASLRTQLIVTTHSDILVDAMTETPECVVVCEKREGKTEMTRLSASELAVWLEKYRLGQLWIQGQIGGTRW